jgi:hypothetical protein
LATCLGVIRSSNVVMDPMFWQILVKVLISEVGSSITNYHSGYSKSWKYGFFKHLLRVLGIRSMTWQGFYPFGDVVDYNQDILAISWLRRWPHVIDSPDIKELNLKVVGEWHGISGVDITVPLTWSTPLDKVLCILVHGWPEESTFLDFCIYSECSIMSSIWWWVTTFNDLESFHWYTPSEQPI